MLSRVTPEHQLAFTQRIERLSNEKLGEKHKRLAWSVAVDRTVAEDIRDLVIGSKNQRPGILSLLAELVDAG